MRPSFTNQFQEDLEKMLKAGKQKSKIKKIIKLIAAIGIITAMKDEDELCIDRELIENYKNHKLYGNYIDRWECHVESDWLIIYKIDKKNNQVIFERTGSHSDLFV